MGRRAVDQGQGTTLRGRPSWRRWRDALLVGVLTWGVFGVAFAAAVPLPRPRPAEAPARVAPAPPPQTQAAVDASRAPHWWNEFLMPMPKAPAGAPVAELPGESVAVPAAPGDALTECRKALTAELAAAPSVPSIEGPGACGGTDMVRLEAVILPDKSRVGLNPPAILRCRMATALVQWVRADIAPLARRQNLTLREIENYDSYSCRSRNRVAGARLSEHAKGNAIDIRAFRFSEGTRISLTDRNAPVAFREAVRQSVCARFATILGPSSDGYHEEHIHLDVAERSRAYTMCRWTVHGPAVLEAKTSDKTSDKGAVEPVAGTSPAADRSQKESAGQADEAASAGSGAREDGKEPAKTPADAKDSTKRGAKGADSDSATRASKSATKGKGRAETAKDRGAAEPSASPHNERRRFPTAVPDRRSNPQ